MRPPSPVLDAGPGHAAAARTRPADFTEILEQIWWRLDLALDLDLVRWSALLGAVEALEAGTTAIVDHHASPAAIDGSLDVIAEACAEVGVRVVCAYEVTDRHGPGGRQGGAGRERAVPAGRRAGAGRRPRLLHPGATPPWTRWSAWPTIWAWACTSTWARTATDAGAADRLRPHAADDWLLAHCVHVEPAAGRDDRPQPPVQPEQRRRLRPPGAVGAAPATGWCWAATASAPPCSRSSPWPTWPSGPTT